MSSLFTNRRGVEEIVSVYLIACCISYFNRNQNNKGLNKGKLYFSHKQTSKLQLVQKRGMGEHGTAPRGCSGTRLLVGPQPLRCFWHLHDQRWKGGKKWGAYSFLLQARSESCMCDFCSYPIGQNIVIWLHLAKREARKCSV